MRKIKGKYFHMFPSNPSEGPQGMTKQESALQREVFQIMLKPKVDRTKVESK
jgi:hypothetical protein